MTIRRIDGELHVECDDCGDEMTASELDMEDADFEEFKDAVKADGWQISHGAGGWTHRCPDCV